MRFRMGLVTGFAVGYVLGSRAGRERYEQIRRAWQSAMRSEPAQQLSHEARGAATRVGQAIEHKATEGVSKVTSLVRNGGDGRSDDDQVTLPPS